MKNGDIVYLKEPYKAKYGKSGGSYYYHFPMDVGFTISNLKSSSCDIYNPIDKTNHFIFGSNGGAFSKLISLQEYRNMIIYEIIYQG